MAETVRIVAVSDTHTLHAGLRVPDGDVLIHAGDLTRRGELESVASLDAFLADLPHPHKVVIAGNHDFCFEDDAPRARALLEHAVYLEDDALRLDGLTLWGSPWQPWFFDWAFNLQRGPEIRAKWELIPPDTDVLVTHGPPFGHGDRTVHGELVGCRDLLEVVGAVRPRLHVFGHIHEGYGVTADEHTTYLNASICDVRYRPVHAPLVHDLVLR